MPATIVAAMTANRMEVLVVIGSRTRSFHHRRCKGILKNKETFTRKNFGKFEHFLRTSVASLNLLKINMLKIQPRFANDLLFENPNEFLSITPTTMGKKRDLVRQKTRKFQKTFAVLPMDSNEFGVASAAGLARVRPSAALRNVVAEFVATTHRAVEHHHRGRPSTTQSGSAA
jgi:hypothetical protein